MLLPLQQFLLSPPLPSFFVFHSLSLSLCLRNVPARVRVYLINAFAIKKFKIPYHISIVKNESKSFVEISFSLDIPNAAPESGLLSTKQEK